MKPRIIDGFIFYNELDMLDYRLSIMYPHVDAFVLVESTRTFIGTSKPLYYQENRERYAQYADKIIHVVVDDMEEKPQIGFDIHSDTNQWGNEDYQRNAISLGIEKISQFWNIQPTDIIIISDIDEIMDSYYLPRIIELLNHKQDLGGIISIRVSIYYYHLCNKLLNEEDHCIRICTYGYYSEIPWLEKSLKQRVKDITNQIRLKKCIITSEICGWHLSYFGSEDYIQNKIRHFSHQEYNQEKYTNKEYIQKCMKTGRDLFEREYNEKDSFFQRIEYSENSYLPPLPPCPVGEDPYLLYPFCLSDPCLTEKEEEKKGEKQHIVDCFIFYNELDMLEYRLSIMYPYVDAFVLVESTRTHKGTLKPLYYQENRERFSAYSDKIVHIVMDDLLAEPKIDYNLNTGEQWVNERHQRDGITLGIDTLAKGKMGWNLGEKDILLISDVDELVDTSRLEILSKVLELPEIQGLVAIAMDMYYYNLKHKLREIWTHAKAIHYSYYLKLPWVEHLYPGMKKVRNISEGVRLSTCLSLFGSYGWHLSYFGNAEMISNKLKEFGHQEYNASIFTNVENIRERIEKGVDILGRPQSSFDFEKIELSENSYLPPFYPGSSSNTEREGLKFPFCL
jgi:beta-1,4-mannosyl-glycoprotein beta-1,4-N-acetylglucosaminyltransferase